MYFTVYNTTYVYQRVDKISIISMLRYTYVVFKEATPDRQFEIHWTTRTKMRGCTT